MNTDHTPRGPDHPAPQLTPPGAAQPGASDLARDDAVVQAYFDRDPALRHEHLREAIRRSPRVAEDIGRTQRIINAMREPVESPDLSSPILDAVDRERSFVASPRRRPVSAIRVAIAASLLGGVGLIAILHTVSRPAPLTVIQTPLAANTLEPPRLDRSLSPPVPQPRLDQSRMTAAVRPPRLSLGDTSDYDRPMASSGGTWALRSPSSGRELPILRERDLWAMTADSRYAGLSTSLRRDARPPLDHARALSVADLLQRSAPSLSWTPSLAQARDARRTHPPAPLASTYFEDMLTGRTEDRADQLPPRRGDR